MAKNKYRYVVAQKFVIRKEIRMGKHLRDYREFEFAEHDLHKLAHQANLNLWQVGIFFQGKLVTKKQTESIIKSEKNEKG
jgi:hypothetical protein